MRRAGKKYRLLKFDVSWSTKPQVRAIGAILQTYASVGDVVEEEKIVEWLDAHRTTILNSVQPAKRLWDYYKGDTAEGLLAHGNIERA